MRKMYMYVFLYVQVFYLTGKDACPREYGTVEISIDGLTPGSIMCIM